MSDSKRPPPYLRLVSSQPQPDDPDELCYEDTGQIYDRRLNFTLIQGDASLYSSSRRNLATRLVALFLVLGVALGIAGLKAPGGHGAWQLIQPLRGSQMPHPDHSQAPSFELAYAGLPNPTENYLSGPRTLVLHNLPPPGQPAAAQVAIVAQVDGKQMWLTPGGHGRAQSWPLPQAATLALPDGPTLTKLSAGMHVTALFLSAEPPAGSLAAWAEAGADEATARTSAFANLVVGLQSLSF